MRIELTIRTPLTGQLEGGEYDPNLDDIRSILIDFCRQIGSDGMLSVGGFGQSIWPVDLVTDLPVLLEQLPYALQSLRSEGRAEIDFYEQGVERSILFLSQGQTCVAKCVSRTNWHPDPDTEVIPCVRLVAMLESVIREFIDALREAHPSLADHPWVTKWLEAQQ